MEVDVVVISRQPTGGGVGNLIGLGSKPLVLNKYPEGFGIAVVPVVRTVFFDS
jgi:hypothetical protein